MQRPFLLLALIVGMTGIARADRREAEFLQALRDQGMADIAVSHLETMESEQTIPPELQLIFDLEYARSLMADAEITPNVDRAAQDLVRARERLEKFLREHGNHPESANAWRLVGQISLVRGDRILRAAQTIKDAARQQSEFVRARAEFEQARPAFQKAVELLGARVVELTRMQAAQRSEAPSRRRSRNNERPTELAVATEDWLESRFFAAQVNYLVGLTYANVADPARVEALAQAAKGFDAIFQGNRATMGGVNAHLWHGRTLEAAGDLRTALDISQEVLGNAPNPDDRNAADRLGFFADVKRSEIELLRKLNRQNDALTEAQLWLDNWKGAQRQPGYQAIAVDFARMLIEKSDQLEPKESERLMGQASDLLNDVAKLPGRYQTEAIRLRRDLSAKLGRTLEIKTFADAVALGEGALQLRDWNDAIDKFKKALDLSGDVRQLDRVDAVRLQLARAQLLGGQFLPAFETANALTREQPPRELSSASAVLALNAALNLVAMETDKEPARKRLFEIADYTQTTWPERAEAAEAAIALGRLKLVEGDIAGAVETFEAIDSASERYGQAQLLAAQSRWRLLQLKIREGAESHVIETEQNAVIQQLQRSIERLQQSSASEGTLQALNDARLQLAEIYQSTSRTDEALALYLPLVDSVMQQPDQELSSHTIRVATGAAGALLAQGNIEKAKSIAEFLSARGSDLPAVNTILVGFAAALRDQWKQSKAAVDSATGSDPAQKAAADEKLAANQAAVVAYVEKLCAREQVSLREKIILGDMASELGRSDLARAQYDKAVKQAESDPDSSARSAAAITRVQAQLVGLLRQEQKYDEALAEVDKLLAKTPKALEPNMERARILLAQAEVKPSLEAYRTSVQAWGRLRAAMSRMPKKPPEYYEAVYNTSRSLAEQANLETDASAAAEARKQARQLLTASLALAPSLSGPDMVQQYQTLLAKLPK